MLSTTGWRSTAIVFIAADSDFHHKDNRAGRSDFLKPRRTRRTNHRAREALDRIHRINKIDSETFCSFCPKNFVTSVFSVVNGADGISDIKGKAATTVFLRRFVMKRSSEKCKLVIVVRLHGRTISIFAPTRCIWKSQVKSWHLRKMPEVCRF